MKTIIYKFVKCYFNIFIKGKFYLKTILYLCFHYYKNSFQLVNINIYNKKIEIAKT